MSLYLLCMSRPKRSGTLNWQGKSNGTPGYFRVLATIAAVTLAACLLMLVAAVASAKTAGNGKIAFASDRDGNSEIYVMDADGSNQTRLTNNRGRDLDPVFSPDGKKIAFTSDRDGNSEIYVMNADGTGQMNLTNDPAQDPSPPGRPIARRSPSPAIATATLRSM